MQFHLAQLQTGSRRDGRAGRNAAARRRLARTEACRGTMRPLRAGLNCFVQCYELDGLDKGDDRLRAQCLPDLQLPGYWPGDHYRTSQLAVALLRAPNLGDDPPEIAVL